MTDHNSVQVLAEQELEDPIVCYVIVRQALNMSVGKCCAQTAHLGQLLVLDYLQLEQDINWTSVAHGDRTEQTKSEQLILFKQWLNADYRKVVLRADEKEWNKLKELSDVRKVIVIDNGKTELPPQTETETETVIGFYPMVKSQAPKLINRLQVLK